MSADNANLWRKKKRFDHLNNVGYINKSFKFIDSISEILLLLKYSSNIYIRQCTEVHSKYLYATLFRHSDIFLHRGFDHMNNVGYVNDSCQSYRQHSQILFKWLNHFLQVSPKYLYPTVFRHSDLFLKRKGLSIWIMMVTC